MTPWTLVRVEIALQRHLFSFCSAAASCYFIFAFYIADKMLYTYVWQILLIYFIFWLFIIVVLLFGNTLICRNTPIGAIYRLMTEKFPEIMG